MPRERFYLPALSVLAFALCAAPVQARLSLSDVATDVDSLDTRVTALEAAAPGGIQGRVTQCGQAYEDMQVFVRGTSYAAMTDAAGAFALTQVQAGTYELTVKKAGAVIGSVGQITVVPRQTADVGLTDFCADQDEDGFTPPLDCDDLSAATHPGAAELCGDGVDNDCDGLVDESCGGGDVGICQSGVSPQPEICDGLDNDCDGEIDEGTQQPVAGGTLICQGGYPVLQCAPGFSDCNGFQADGCEIDVASDPTNCGACFSSCGGASQCIEGSCSSY